MRTFRTWSGVHQATPSRWATPGTEAEVIAVLREADRAGRRVKPIGSGHSWSDIAVPDPMGFTRRPARSASRTSAITSASVPGVAHREGVASWTPDQVRNVRIVRPAARAQSRPCSRNQATASRMVSSIGR